MMGGLWNYNMIELIEAHYRKNYDSFVKRGGYILKDPHLAQDCTQEAYERAIKYARTIEGDTIDGWMHRIFFNTALKYLAFIRDKGATCDPKPTDDVIFPPSFVSSFKDTISEDIDTYEAKPKVKDILKLYIVKGYTGEEVEMLTSSSSHATRGHVKRFKKHLMEKYNEPE